MNIAVIVANARSGKIFVECALTAGRYVRAGVHDNNTLTLHPNLTYVWRLIALPKKLFITSTFFGTILRDFVYLYIGFSGLSAAAVIVDGIKDASSIITIILGLIGVGIFTWTLCKKYFSSNKLLD